MTYSFFHHSLWAEMVNAGMKPSAQGLFLFLTFNSNVNPIGLYSITDAQIKAGCGYDLELDGTMKHIEECSGGAVVRSGNLLWNAAIPENWKHSDPFKFNHDGFPAISVAMKFVKHFGKDDPACRAFLEYNAGKVAEYERKCKQNSERVLKHYAKKNAPETDEPKRDLQA